MSHLNPATRMFTGLAVGMAVLTGTMLAQPTSAQAAAVALPPTHANFDYQIGGAYTPPTGVKVVTRDHTASPAAGLYNICYINAFQAQPGAEGEWASDLLLRDSNGNVVYDEDWGEALLDTGTAAKRQRIADQIGTQIDGCRDKGFQAVEPDNYDSYTRSGNRLTANNAQAFIKLLSTEPTRTVWPSRRRTPPSWPATARPTASTSPSPKSAASTTNAATTPAPSATTSS